LVKPQQTSVFRNFIFQMEFLSLRAAADV
jgi:hypothetical protein